LLIKALYDRWEIIAVGERFDVQHGSCESILKELEEATPERLAELLQANPLIIPNPLTGQKALTKSGKPSFRCDEAIAKRRFAIAEMDRATLCEQAGFWHYMVRSEFPVAAIIHSGGKSLHAWIKVDCANAEEWDTMVKRRLFQRILIPLGCDAACSNPSRLSRLSGHYREEKQAYQRLLYLNGGV
jgi:hypothetical protein